jgi:hypothetical protein
MSTLSHSAVLGLVPVPVGLPAYNMPMLGAETSQDSNRWRIRLESVAEVLALLSSTLVRIARRWAITPRHAFQVHE